MKILENITLCCVDCNTYGAAVAALKKSLEQITPARTIFLTDIPIKIDGIEVIQIKSISSKRAYSNFCIKELHKYFDTDYVLLVQNDGWVLSGDSWDDEFFNYDFIGAPWLYQDGRNVGNGGVSIRSRKLQNILGTDDFIKIFDPEDEVIGRLYRRYLEENYDIKFPTEELADKFSFELRTPVTETFAFHGGFHERYKPTVIIRRQAALGDVVCCEPVLQYFHDKGYRVVLDTLPQFQMLFINHYFKVHRLQEVDQRLLATAKYVNLDMAYEVNPKQLHLKSYFEYAGVPEEDYKGYIKNPTLSLGFPLNAANKLFKKYAVIHVDNRPQPGRNIYGVDWEYVVDSLKLKGFTVIQVGRDDTAVIENATQINCTNENFLCYVVGGADLMIGIDSGISHIASAFKIPSVILFGSVDPKVIHADLSGKEIIHLHDQKVCDKPFCWGSVIGTEGVECYIDKKSPPCTKFKTYTVIDAINKIHDNNIR